MKTSSTCPKCGSTKLYVVDEVRQPAHDSSAEIVPMNVTTASVPSKDVGLVRENVHRAAIGTFEAWICAQCGLTEWYAKDFMEAFERLVNLGRRVHVRIVDRSTPHPFR